MSIKDKLQLNYSDNILIEGIEEKDINITLENAVSVGSSLTGNVKDTDGNSVSGVTVKIFDAAGKPYRHTLTDDSGNYSFSSLPAGNYTVTAVKDNYLLSLGSNIIISEDELKTLELSITADTTAYLNVVAGVVFDFDSGLTLGDATISIIDTTTNESVATTISADDGEYVFYDIADGSYKIIAIKDGYIANTPIELTVRNGQTINAYIKLTQDPISNTGTISGIVRNNNAVVSGCFVGLYNVVTKDGIEVEQLVSCTKTNASGAYMFGRVDSGKYKVKAKLNANTLTSL